jgi:hypothetical protein
VAERLTTGFTKSVKFISCDWTPFTTLVGPAQSGFQYNITTGLVHPLRLWILGYPVLAANGTLGGNVLLQPWFAPGVITGSFIQCNVLVNNIPYFRQNFQVTEDKWEQLKEQFVRSQFIYDHSFVCFDASTYLCVS